MAAETKTIIDKRGNVWTGKPEAKHSDIGDLLFGLVTGGVGFAALTTTEPTTVVVNDTRHTGTELKSK